MKRFTLTLAMASLLTQFVSGAEAVKPGEDLQVVLDRGNDLVLQTGAVYPVTQTLRYRKSGQKIYTKDARYPAQFATLRLADKKVTQLISAEGIAGAVLEHVICDGRRYELSVISKAEAGGKPTPALVQFGARGGDKQIVRECVFMNTRSWSTLKVHEGASGCLIENNFIFGAGADCRGNGREDSERELKWGDGITFAARDSVIRNNLIIDPTDVGFVLFGSPGTVAENNVVASVSRESLGGANLVDAIKFYAMDAAGIFTDYHGVKIRNNYVDAFGSRIHIGFPMGCTPWAPRLKGKILVGAEVASNTMAGGAGAYGFVAHGLKDWKVEGNVSTASYSGIGEGLGPKKLPNEPAPFLFDPITVTNVELQKEFVKCNPHIEHLLRCNHGPLDAQGYRIYSYGETEAHAVVQSAYLEMLGRKPAEDEKKECVQLLQANKFNADGLRRRMMASTEFVNRFGNVPPEELQPYRTKLWMGICNDIIEKNIAANGKWPSAKSMYLEALDDLRIEKRNPKKIEQVMK